MLFHFPSSTLGFVEYEACELRNAGMEGPSWTMAYTGDTGMTEALLPLAERADLLLAEASLAESEAADFGHLGAAEAGRVVAEAGVGQLVLTHFGSADHAWAQAR